MGPSDQQVSIHMETVCADALTYLQGAGRAAVIPTLARLHARKARVRLFNFFDVDYSDRDRASAERTLEAFGRWIFAIADGKPTLEHARTVAMHLFAEAVLELKPWRVIADEADQHQDLRELEDVLSRLLAEMRRLIGIQMRALGLAHWMLSVEGSQA